MTRAFGPRNEARVYWVGHSLINSEVQSSNGFSTVMEGVKTLAGAAGQSNSYFDHTMFGAPLSLNFRGSVHSYRRSEPTMVERRRELDSNAANYDTIVMTEALPLRWQIKKEFSAYYVRKFAHALRQTNPRARVYLYESWPHLHGSDPHGDYPSLSAFHFVKEVRTLRPLWESIAESAERGDATEPGLVNRIKSRFLGNNSASDAGGPVHLIPVASAMARLHERLEKEPVVSMTEFFANPLETYPIEWPDGAPVDADRSELLNQLTRKDASKDLDDIHPSELGIFFAALVSYATLYGKDPTGLEAPSGVSDEIAKLLSAVAWDAVKSDTKTGVS